MTEFQIQTSTQLTSHLRSLRKSAGLTQTQLGSRLGIEQARVAKIERNPGSISVDQLLEVLNVLGVALFVRLRATPPQTPADPRVTW